MAVPITLKRRAGLQLELEYTVAPRNTDHCTTHDAGHGAEHHKPNSLRLTDGFPASASITELGSTAIASWRSSPGYRFGLG